MPLRPGSLGPETKKCSCFRSPLRAFDRTINLTKIYAVLIRGGIIALTVFIIYLMIQNISYYKTSIQDSSLLLVVVGLLSFAVSSFFVGVYSDSMESIYMTYLMDVDAGMDGGNCPDALK